MATPKEKTDQKLDVINDRKVPQDNGAGVWKILIVDDEKAVHDVTRLALRNLEFEGRKLQFISAFSAAEVIGTSWTT